MNSFCHKIIIITLSGFMLIMSIAAGESRAKFAQQSQPMASVDSAAALNNSGNLYLNKIQNNSACLDTAIIYYYKAVKKAPLDGGIKLNLGIAYLMKGESEKADSLFKVAFTQCDSSRERVYQLLGMDYKKPKSDKGTVENLTEAQLKGSLESSFSKIKPKDKKSKKGKRSTKGKKKKPTRSAGRKSFDPKVMKNYLYWKL